MVKGLNARNDVLLRIIGVSVGIMLYQGIKHVFF